MGDVINRTLGEKDLQKIEELKEHFKKGEVFFIEKDKEPLSVQSSLFWLLNKLSGYGIDIDGSSVNVYYNVLVEEFGRLGGTKERS